MRIILGLAACSPAIVNVTSAKNDITIALLSLLFWLWIYHANPKSPWYVAVGLLIAALMVGTKWHGLALGAMFMALLGVEMVKAGSFRAASIALAVCALPLAWYVSSADVYLENWRIDGSICPTPSYLQQRFNVPRNVAAFTANSLAETFEVPFYAADVWLQGKLWPWLNRMTFGAKAWNYAIMPTTHVTVYGVTILGVIAGATAAACARRTPRPVRAAALAAVGYCALLLCCFDYSTYINRYFLVTYILGLVPCAYLAQFIAWPRWVRWTFYSYLVFVSLQSVLLNQEKRLLPFKMYAAAGNCYYEQKALQTDLFDREALQFHLWTGHLAPYRVLRQNLRKQDRLLIVNCHEGNSCPFIYPFLKERTSTNTRIANLRFGQSVPHDAAQQFEYVLVFRGRRSDPGFLPLYEDPDVAIYQNARLAADKGD